MSKSLFTHIYDQVKQSIFYFRHRKKTKIFCIGRNKTGTTSMAAIFKILNIPVASQRKAELLTIDVLNGNYTEFFKYVKYGGVAFQDAPFSLSHTYKILDKEFPDSKFILTVRDSPEIWYSSLTRYHAKLFGDGKIPTKSDLKRAKYVYPGWIWEINRLHYGTPEDDVYNKDILIQQYINYNKSVVDYFQDQPEKLLVVNLKDANAAKAISQFLESTKQIDEIPWHNKT